MSEEVYEIVRPHMLSVFAGHSTSFDRIQHNRAGGMEYSPANTCRISEMMARCSASTRS